MDRVHPELHDPYVFKRLLCGIQQTHVCCIPQSNLLNLNHPSSVNYSYLANSNTSVCSPFFVFIWKLAGQIFAHQIMVFYHILTCTYLYPASGQLSAFWVPSMFDRWNEWRVCEGTRSSSLWTVSEDGCKWICMTYIYGECYCSVMHSVNKMMCFI